MARFLMRRDLKWHSHPFLPVVKTLRAFLREVERDDDCCFFG
ncbi:MAG: DUF3024 domain-containing protein [Acidobacteria bacterium]|nr:DUF3024 domain-containing protein [Acidobacteriota bacterium]